MDWIVVQEIIAGVLIIGALYYVGRNIYKSSIEKKGDVSVCNSCSADCNKCPFHTKENKIKVSNFAKQHKNNNDKIMLDRLNLETILFLDIETVPQYSQYEEVPEKLRSLWDKKASHILKKEEETPENIYTRAGIFSEFGKIVCISVGIFQFGEGGKEKFRVKSFYDHDEKILLTGFSEMLNKCMSDKYNILCGHNIKEFDIPFIARRLIINGLPLPSIIDIEG
ncbi:MAG: 3'-5' exonuclease, partial [Bacteroidota bacterium]|nr:3'-5' exonuclease [Bacteroidota bacterium]